MFNLFKKKVANEKNDNSVNNDIILLDGKRIKISDDVYIFDKNSLRSFINDSIGEVKNPDLLNDRTKNLIAWARSNTDISDIRESRARRIGF